MKNKIKVHPEVADIYTICEIAPDTKYTKEVCEKINKEKAMHSKKRSSSTNKSR